MTQIKKIKLKNFNRDYIKVRDLCINIAKSLERSHRITGEPHEDLHFKVDMVIHMNPMFYQILKDSGIEFEDYH